jgi:hypothetical protein
VARSAPAIVLAGTLALGPGGLALACAVGPGSTTGSAASLGGYGEGDSTSSATGELESSVDTHVGADIDVDFDPGTSSEGSGGETGDASTGDASTGAGDSTGGGAMVGVCPSQPETFASHPGWLPKNLPDGKNDYGYSPGTSNTGGGAGEIGGRFQRSTHRTAYAHVIPPLNGASCLYASGRIAIPRVDDDFRSRVSFGHFDGLGGAHVGFDVANEENGNVRIFIMAGGLSELAFIVNDPATHRTWDYFWDPTTSTMTLTIDGLGTVTRPLSPGQAAAIQGLDRFGIRHDDHEDADNHPGIMKLYLDEIDYTR